MYAFREAPAVLSGIGLCGNQYNNVFIRIFNTIVSIVLGTVLNIAMDTALGAVLNVVLNSALNIVLLTLLCEYRIKYYNTEHRKSVDYVSRQICRL